MKPSKLIQGAVARNLFKHITALLEQGEALKEACLVYEKQSVETYAQQKKYCNDVGIGDDYEGIVAKAHAAFNQKHTALYALEDKNIAKQKQ